VKEYMKKGLMILSLGLACGLIAYGATVSVPIVVDDGSASVAANNFAPATGTATFIAFRNGTGAAQTCTITMADYAGTDVTPAANTFVVAAGNTTSIRPVATDASVEAPGLAGMNATSALGGAVSVTVTLPGAATQWSCRVSALNNTASFGYTVIPF
jgi:hypothetical protein